MTTVSTPSTTTHVYEIYIRAAPDVVWSALTDPAYTREYFHGTHFESGFAPGDSYRSLLADGSCAVDGVIEVFDPPHRLVLTWHALFSVPIAAEPPSRVEWLLTPANTDASITRVTLRHGDLALSPLTWANVRLGWVVVIDGLKTLLETGTPLGLEAGTGSDHGHSPDEHHDDVSTVEEQWHRSAAVTAHNSTWALLDARTSPGDLTATEADDLLGCAYASAYHWARAAGRTPTNAARASWLLSRVHVVLGFGTLALHHADACAREVETAGLVDFDLGYAHEARARALACLGRTDEARTELELARATPVADPEDREIYDADLAAAPWFDLTT
jgi:uncharacterized protein YndB with AHSA1/START domain